MMGRISSADENGISDQPLFQAEFFNAIRGRQAFLAAIACLRSARFPPFGQRSLSALLRHRLSASKRLI
jgi:hypothetical protein